MPAPIDGALEGWWRLPPRLRTLAATLLLVGLVAATAVRASRSPWGAPRPVVVATSDALAGQSLDAAAPVLADRPGDLVPPDAVSTMPEGLLARDIAAGAVVTGDHVTAGLADLLEPGEVALPLDTELPAMPPHARLDVLGLGFDGTGQRLGRARLLARDEPWTWIAMDADDAAAVAAARATGGVHVAVVATTRGTDGP